VRNLILICLPKMDFSIVIILFLLSFLIFAIPQKYKWLYTRILQILFISLNVFLILDTMLNSIFTFQFPFKIMGYDLILKSDFLSAIFNLTIQFTCFTGLWFGKKYLKHYQNNTPSFHFSIHYFSFIWLQFALTFLTIIDNGVIFLMFWEIMSITSFVLVIFLAGEKSTLKIGINYLVQMHIGFLFLVLGFIMTGKNGNYSISNISEYFSSHSNFPLFTLFFIGFGFKAGFVPLHTWLPTAHPAAPSHISGVMSGAMIKIGLFGIIKILMMIQNDLVFIYIFVLTISIITGIYGAMFSTFQNDIKKLLAYSSIENIGIIGLGLSIYVLGKYQNSNYLQIIGLTSSILHIVNHSLYKSMLFYTSGNIYQQYHTRNMNQLGGIIKKMPHSALIFLVGSLSICAFPIFNGFTSEYLIINGLSTSLHGNNIYISISLMTTIFSIILMGGLSFFAFSKAFGITFLGRNRNTNKENEITEKFKDLSPQYFITFGILIFGIFPFLITTPILNSVIEITRLKLDTELYNQTFYKISGLIGILLLVIFILLKIRSFRLKKAKVIYEQTWNCGYENDAKSTQYTSASYSENLNQLMGDLVFQKKSQNPISNIEIVPNHTNFKSENKEFFQVQIKRVMFFIVSTIRNLAILQTGKLQHYVLYPFLFLLIIALLTWLNII